MNLQLFAGDTYLGSIEAEIIDGSMGVIGGMLQPSEAYIHQFQSLFRSHSEKPHWEINWEEIRAFDLKAVSQVSRELLDAEGGICITDAEDFVEILVEVCGVNLSLVMKDFD